MRKANARRAMARMAVVVLALVAISGLSALAGHAAAPFTIAIDKPVPFHGLTATLTGVADSPSNADHHIDVDWGDGSTEQIALDGSGPWTWGPVDHTYANDDPRTITVTLIHAQETGNDKSEATDSAEVTPPCVVDCPDGGGDTGGDTGGDVGGDTGGSGGGDTGGSPSTPPVKKPTKVLAETHRKPLAHTASETATAAWFGAMLLLVGATIRFCAVTPPDQLVNEDGTDELVGRSLDLVMRSVRPRR